MKLSTVASPCSSHDDSFDGNNDSSFDHEFIKLLNSSQHDAALVEDVFEFKEDNIPGPERDGLKLGVLKMDNIEWEIYVKAKKFDPTTDKPPHQKSAIDDLIFNFKCKTLSPEKFGYYYNGRSNMAYENGESSKIRADDQANHGKYAMIFLRLKLRNRNLKKMRSYDNPKDDAIVHYKIKKLPSEKSVTLTLYDHQLHNVDGFINSNGKFKVDIKIFHRSLFSKLTPVFSFRDQIDPSQMCLSVDGEKFYVSKEVLLRHSGYFQAMFSSNFSEAKNDGQPIETSLKNTGVCVDSFELLLRFMYGDLPINNIWLCDSGRPLAKMLRAADFFQVSKFPEAIEQFLLNSSRKVDVMRLLVLAEKFGFHKLYNLCLYEYLESYYDGRSYSSSNSIKKLVKDHDFKKLSAETKEKILERFEESFYDDLITESTSDNNNSDDEDSDRDDERSSSDHGNDSDVSFYG